MDDSLRSQQTLDTAASDHLGPARPRTTTSVPTPAPAPARLHCPRRGRMGLVQPVDHLIITNSKGMVPAHPCFFPLHPFFPTDATGAVPCRDATYVRSTPNPAPAVCCWWLVRRDAEISWPRPDASRASCSRTTHRFGSPPIPRGPCALQLWWPDARGARQGTRRPPTGGICSIHAPVGETETVSASLQAGARRC